MRPRGRPRLRPLAALLALPAVLALAPPRARAEPPSWEAHLERIAPSVVVLRYVVTVTISLGGQQQVVEQDVTKPGVVVDPTGIVLASNTLMAGTSSPFAEAVRKRFPAATFDANVDRIRVLAGGEERDAVLVARDSPLDLAWVQVLDGPRRPLAAASLAEGGTLRVGRKVFLVTRMGQGFDHAPELVRVSVTSRMERPRPLWGVYGHREVGLLAFDREGLPVGAVLYVHGGEADDPSRVGTALLPLDDVRKSLEAARPLAARALADHAKRVEAEPAPR